MRLGLKWFVCYAATAIYVIVIGGFFFFNMFKFVFDHKLQQEVAEQVVTRKPTLAQGLASNKPMVDPSELFLLTSWLKADDRIQSIIYLNRDASIRWHKVNQYLGKSYDDARAEDVFFTNAVAQSFNTGRPRVIMYGNGNYYDMAFPLRSAQDEIIGVVNIQVSRESAKRLINDATIKYGYSAFIIMALMGFILTVFIYLKIINPLNSLVSSIETVSLKELRIHFKERNDEIGDVAVAVNEFLKRVKKEFSGIEAQSRKKEEMEQLWWKALLAVSITKGSRALVVDEDNNIMFANFEIEVKKDGPLHLLDIFDGQQSQIIEVIGKAMDEPGKVYRGETAVGSNKFSIRAVQLPVLEENPRTMIVLEPEK
ncbi:putative sensor with HAMP domain [Elusimicrobium minutum Pei191]|uniref:Putative sensor with HAMP domain n=1 Tax=Elusimicrobium minutum (strain Pei191) TaxID=445932 RepID=B2KE06_ELUMP|nr:HAMP domain-containing protein [Elusimicrobium minutum]ACC98752.1 putative sensor with HAMP domain [Elusimicrobium minutum Pei191]